MEYRMIETFNREMAKDSLKMGGENEKLFFERALRVK
jgi:hypothetical protein